MRVATAHTVLAFQRKLLKRAIEICGGGNALCVRVGVNEHALRLWLNGTARMPDKVFLKAADIVVDDDIRRACEDRRHAPRIAAIPPDAGSPKGSEQSGIP
jgi:hypothetical protein